MVSLIANDKWIKLKLQYVVSYNKRRATKTALFINILEKREGSNGDIKFASATFQLVEAPKCKTSLSLKISFHYNFTNITCLKKFHFLNNKILLSSSQKFLNLT